MGGLGGLAAGSSPAGMAVLIPVLAILYVFAHTFTVTQPLWMAFLTSADGEDLGVFGTIGHGYRCLTGKRWKLFGLHFMVTLLMAVPYILYTFFVGAKLVAAFTAGFAGGPIPPELLAPGLVEVLVGLFVSLCGLFWTPYLMTTTATFYDDLKD